MNLELYQRISLSDDIPEYGLKKGDVGTIVEFIDHPEGGEKGCAVEIFNALGESIDVITIPVTKVSTLNPDEIMSVRHFSRAV